MYVMYDLINTSSCDVLLGFKCLFFLSAPYWKYSSHYKNRLKKNDLL